MQHGDDRGDHHRWAAKVVFYLRWIFVIFQVALQGYLVDKASMALPIVLGQGLGERERVFEIRKVLGNCLKFLCHKIFTQRACAIKEAHAACGLQRMEKMKEMAAHGRHSGAATYIDHLSVTILNKEFAIGPGKVNFITRL